MRRLVLMFALVTPSTLTPASLLAAELEIPLRRPVSENVSMQKGPPNCVRWATGTLRKDAGHKPLKDSARWCEWMNSTVPMQVRSIS